jgi:hypothetical protein
MLDPRVRAHDWNMLNNREPRGLFKGRGADALRLDNPTKNVIRRDASTTGVMPVTWFNDAGGVTVGVRFRGNYLGRFQRSLGLFTRGLDPDATQPGGVYLRWENPVAISCRARPARSRRGPWKGVLVPGCPGIGRCAGAGWTAPTRTPGSTLCGWQPPT